MRNLQILKENAGRVSFCHQSSPVSRTENLHVALNIAGVEKYARKTCGCCQPGGHPIRVLNETSVSNGGNLCPSASYTLLAAEPRN